MIIFSNFNALGGLSRRIYIGFLLAAVIPTALAGAIGVYLSLNALKNETSRNLLHEVTVRAQGIGRFFGQLSAELLYLANARGPVDVLNADTPGRLHDATTQLEHDYAALARLYPHVYQIRLIGADGHERVRVDRRPQGVYVVPRRELQQKGERYYFRDAMAVPVGQIYESPLDLNVEFGQTEKPERPVIRVATPVAGPDGSKLGVLIINLHADILLTQIQELADTRRGTAYLMDNRSHYVSRSVGAEAGAFKLEPMENLSHVFTHKLVEELTEGIKLTHMDGGWIVAHAPIDYAPQVDTGASAERWRIALAFPERELFLAVVNLSLLYLVLGAALIVTVVGGFVFSRRMLRPLEALSRETEAITSGDYTRRVTVIGDDEIAALGNKFNGMASRLQESSQLLGAQRDRLVHEVQAQTQELEQKRVALEAVIEHTADGILSIDSQGKISLLNSAATALLGGESIALGTPVARFWPQWTDMVRDAAGRPMRCDVQLPEQIVSVAMTPTSEGYVVVARDVSSEREVQEARRGLDRQMFQMEKLNTLGELAMGLAHEIGNPLAGMKAVAQALQYEDDLSPGVVQGLKRMESEVDRLSRFLRSFHGFAMEPQITSVPCDLGLVLEDVLFWVRKDASTRGVSFDVDGVDGLPYLMADPNQLKQVFLNLLMNAVHAMPHGGAVTVRTAAFGNSIRINVRDTGLGMDATVLKRVFEPFFTTRADGTGLGLAIVRKIVVQHGATIEVSSVLGHETCFSMVWPLANNRHA